MSDTKSSSPSRKASSNGEGVLANLPRTRPQRSSPRRAAARRTTAARSDPPPSPARDAERSSSPRPGRARAERSRPARAEGARPARTRSQRPRPAGAARSAETSAGRRTRTAAGRSARASGAGGAPRQGFESEGEGVSGTVTPPGGAELAATAAELVGELAKAGLSTGERVLRDVFSRLRPS